MKKVVKSEEEAILMQLSDNEVKEIIESKKDIENGSFIENKLLNKEVKIWLKQR